ncbi:MAG: selenide, water dikinase SelD [Ardenticatenaceae bacterium]|nr:selenide, water dikinase SelD [Ardenticatenaceae bacterium]
MLQPLRETFDATKYPNLLVGLEKADDAAVYQINDHQAIISTTDFFPPVVDDPYDFGAIAAANAMSDIYAMGGKVLFAVNLVAFPDNLAGDVLREVLRGGAEKVAEAGGVIAGGHSVNDKEPKYGLAVTGIIDPALVKRKGGAQPGDVLLLTKPLGVGVITTALKQQVADPAHVATAVASMKILNRQASEAALRAQAHGMTDITGFGLLGHAHEMAQQAGVDFRFFVHKLPWLPGALAYGEAGTFPGGKGNNSLFFHPHVTFADGVPELVQDMLWTPETSGGLLVALAPEQVEAYLAGCETAVIIGNVIPGHGHIYVDY